MDMRLIEQQTGEDSAQQILFSRCEVPHVLIHNHPSGMTFSHGDIRNFIFRGHLTMMTVVGNDGRVYVLSKGEQYDGFFAYHKYLELEAVLSECMKIKDMEGYIHAVADFLERGCAYGLKFIKRGA